MEKNTILAIVLSVVVVLGFYFVQGIFFPPKPSLPANGSVPVGASAPGTGNAAAVVPADGASAPGSAAIGPAGSGAAGPSVEAGELNDPAGETGPLAESAPVSEQRVVINTEILTVTLSSAGGDIVSWKLKEHDDKGEPVEMILSGGTEAHAFSVAFGDQNAPPVDALFHVRRLSDYSVEFYRNFTLFPGGPSPGRFTLTKRYDFKPDEFMFELTVLLDGGYSVPGFDFTTENSGNVSHAAYTLITGPQIGPSFEKLDQRYEYRQYITYTNGKRRLEKINDERPNIINSRPNWAAIAGKYFTLIAIPYPAQYDMVFSARPEPGLVAASRLYIIRPPLSTSRAEDTYRFYIGPKNQESLAIYNNGKNGFNLQNTQLIEAANTRGFLSPLERVLKWLLLIFYRIVPNYGVAIILLTLFVKVIFFPLTKKSSESTLRMQAISPKIKELQAKYKDNPQKMNTEMAELYKKEGYNPVSGCLPMLLQIPIFFAMYNLFNNHFDLRGAMFIPQWIPDLSLPESVYHFSDFRLPILGWTDIRLLPFIYVGSQLLYGKVTQTPDQQNNTQMKLMLYAMPLIFFFILYDVPSGLLIYWIFSNILTLVQQLAINKYLAPKRAAQAAAAREPVIAPRKRKKK
ncbi:MAG: membrane protein insertase YidC [Treponema sp.]|jgi:YidC/Oxa1 family membrane protein insertase|nr:membrane protein insertase YidC [Treponema sp.]